MRLTNHQNLPHALVRAALADNYDKGDCDFSVTELLKPPRQRAIEKKCEAELEEDVSDTIYRLMGKIGHAIIEAARDPEEHDEVIEQRFFADITGVRISGKPDLFQAQYGWDIWDWKFTSIWTTRDGIKPEWTQQLNMLKWLAEKNGFIIGKLYIGAIYRDWSKPQSLYKQSYPKHQAEPFEVEVWSREETERFILERIKAHYDAMIELPECTASERWADPDVWKCKKKGGKRAVPGGVFTTEAEAILFAEKRNLEVEFRPAVSKRCECYCAAAPFCSQWQAMKPSAPIVEEEI